MKESGIMMSGDHPRKILDGTKTMTRRTYGLEKINDYPYLWHKPFYDEETGYWNFWQVYTGDVLSVKCPYGHVGDLLWVRETFCRVCYDSDNIQDVCYKEDCEANPSAVQCNRKWTPSIFMPRWASRIQMPIDLLRPERLQEITFRDAKAEGILRFDGDHPDDNGGMGYNRGASGLPMRYNSTAAFMDLWDSLKAKRGYSWKFNPWVWVIGWSELASQKFAVTYAEGSVAIRKTHLL